jgi:polyisoprenyl-teichoic acid--peptidoglycan teichoic acid transferase
VVVLERPAVRLLLSLSVALLLASGLSAVRLRTNDDAGIVVGRPPAAVQQPLAGPAIVPAPTTTTAPPSRVGSAGAGSEMGSLPEPVAQPGLRQPDTEPYGAAIPFVTTEPMPDGLVFVLLIGSDARPGEALDRSRADSIHLAAVNPASGTGTVVGFPRDAWVEIPGHGRGKINSALAIGGPDLLSATVQQLTGLPVHWWVLTGFDGLTAMVDGLGGLRVEVARRMADRNSGAFFERGWHAMAGAEVLAFSRDRQSVERGDFTRSEHQGAVLLHALAKLRSEVGDMGGIRRWADVLWSQARLDAAFDDVVRLGAAARRIDPRSVTNLVVPGRVGTAGRASVVYLTEDAAALFEDLRDDATVGAAPPPTTTTTTTAPVTTTTTTTIFLR